ncbi:transthyretin family protein [Nannochloropsis gaditana]|uniref:5-hydroxyisourate hydrolase n=3 Tax=Nannochloropsis gaditana TaxID=72520 RepID=W7TL27_9STRA|nr:transthyretin family protein [Nannochloropsis gaditana]
MPASSTTPATSRLTALAAHLSSVSVTSNPKMSPKRSPITSHVLDTTLGKPAQGMPLRLEQQGEHGIGNGNATWTLLGEGLTNADGRVEDLLPSSHTLSPGIYKITFDVAVYFRAINTKSFYPSVTIEFEVERPEEHYHVPLLINPFAYSTYRGS